MGAQESPSPPYIRKLYYIKNIIPETQKSNEITS